jgi:membrane-anchored protein YejM (alkaline phosphatase superfamily)
LAFAAVLAALLAALALAGALPNRAEGRSVASLLLQHAAVMAVLLALFVLAHLPVLRGVLMVAAAAYLLAVEADTASMAVFGVPADAVARLVSYGDDPSSVLAQAHVSAADLVALGGVVLGQLVLLAWLYRRLPRRPLARPSVPNAVALLLVAAFVGEQMLARGSDAYLHREAMHLAYLHLFAGSPDSFTFAMPRPASESRLDQAVARVTGAHNPKNVVFILLESVRYDAIDGEYAPNLTALAEDSLRFTNAYAESTYTARVWNVLLLNRPSYMVFRDAEMLESGQAGPEPGAFPARVLHQAGYQIFVSMSTKFDWFGFQRRFLGNQGLVDRFFSAYPGNNRERNVADDRATDRLVSWIEEPALDKPFFALIQLDSTHYRYFFDDVAVVKPYAVFVGPWSITSQENLDLLYNRYKNAVHHVDYNIGRIVDALRSSGHYDDTAIVVISDHGESFALGSATHVQVNTVTKHVPWLLHLPGVPPARVDKLTSHRDVFPTLFEYLGIEGLDHRVLLGHSVWSATRRSVLTLQGAMRQAMLTFRLCAIVFDLGWSGEESLTFSPVGVVGVDGKAVAHWRDLLSSLPWKSELETNLRWARAAEAVEHRPGTLDRASDGGNQPGSRRTAVRRAHPGDGAQRPGSARRRSGESRQPVHRRGVRHPRSRHVRAGLRDPAGPAGRRTFRGQLRKGSAWPPWASSGGESEKRLHAPAGWVWNRCRALRSDPASEAAPGEESAGAAPRPSDRPAAKSAHTRAEGLASPPRTSIAIPGSSHCRSSKSAGRG